MPALTSFIDLAVLVKCFGVATSYLIVLSDLMPAAVETWKSPGAAEREGSYGNAERQLWVRHY